MKETYRAMEEAIVSLAKAGASLGLVNHLGTMAQVAIEDSRLDLALLNVRAAIEWGQKVGTANLETLQEMEARLMATVGVPFRSVVEECEVLKDQVRRLLRRAARKRMLEGKLNPDLRFEYEVTAREFETIVEPATVCEDLELFSLEREVVAGRMVIELRANATPVTVPSIASVAKRLELTTLERDVLVTAMMPAISEDFLRAYMRVWGDYLKREPDVAFLSTLVALNEAEEREARLSLEEDSKLVMLRLLTLHAPEGRDGCQALRKAVRVAPWLVRLALGHPQPARHTFRFSDIASKVATVAADALPALNPIKTFLGAEGAGLLVLYGVERQDLESAVLAASAGRPVLGVDFTTSSEDSSGDEVWEACGEAKGFGGVLVLDASEALEGNEDRVARAASAVVSWGQKAILLVTEDPERLPIGHIPSKAVRVETPDMKEQTRVWEVMLGDKKPKRPDTLYEVATRYPLSLAAIVRAALLVLQEGAEVTGEVLLDAARSQMPVRSVRLSQRVPPGFTWEDLVLPDEVLVALNEIVTYYRYREQVFDKWGFRRKLPYGRALSALFHGPSGTGKTMAASVLASEFKVPLFQVNLASIISKYVGETEKNLAMVFDDAARSKAMLLFDEADSLFARRTTGSTAIDRYSNLEVNFLLQRMEEYDGLVVLTTNQESLIDSAFKRRIRFKVPFPAPDAALREELWRSMLRGVGAVTKQIDYAALASRYELCGGAIKNAVLRAAFQAAEEGSPITMGHLLKAAIREYKESGHLVRERNATS